MFPESPVRIVFEFSSGMASFLIDFQGSVKFFVVGFVVVLRCWGKIIRILFLLSNEQSLKKVNAKKHVWCTHSVVEKQHNTQYSQIAATAPSKLNPREGCPHRWRVLLENIKLKVCLRSKDVRVLMRQNLKQNCGCVIVASTVVCVATSVVRR